MILIAQELERLGGQSRKARRNSGTLKAACAPAAPAPRIDRARSNPVVHRDGHFSDGSRLDITQQLTWDSTNNSVATINSRGVAQGITSGTTTVSATVNGVTGTATLTVQ